MHTIVGQNRKYDLVDSPPPQAARKMCDHFAAPYGIYDKLKVALIFGMVALEQKKLQELLRIEELGDRRPS